LLAAAHIAALSVEYFSASDAVWQWLCLVQV